MAFVRPYKASDEEAIIHIFRETAHSALKEAGDPALHYASYNWARPYIMLVPEHCSVIDDGSGTAVGYLLGVPNTSDFVEDYHRRYLPHLKSQGQSAPEGLSNTDEDESDMALHMQSFTWKPESMLQQDYPTLLANYPGHLHIDILPAYQGQGWGRKLIEQLLDAFRTLGVRGIHLGKVGSSVGAGAFYAKLGFERFSEVMDGGASGETGRAKDGGVTLVITL